MPEPELQLAVHDVVLVEAEEAGRMVVLRAIVVHVMPDAVWMGLTATDPTLEMLKPGQPLAVTVRRGSAAAMASSTFVGHLGSTKGRLFSIEKPSPFKQIQRREHLRVATSCQLEFSATGDSDSALAGRAGRGITRDVSAGGLLFGTTISPETAVVPGDLLDLRVAIGAYGVTAEAQVVRVEDTPKPSKSTAGSQPDAMPASSASTEGVRLVAVKFVSISEAAQDRIIRHIFSLHRLRRNEGRKR